MHDGDGAEAIAAIDGFPQDADFDEGRGVLQRTNDGAVPNARDFQWNGFAKSSNQQFGADFRIKLLRREFVEQDFAWPRRQIAFGDPKRPDVVLGGNLDAFRGHDHAAFGLGFWIFGTISPFKCEGAVHPSHGDLNAGPTSNGLQNAAFNATSTRMNHAGGGFADGIREA